MTYCYNHPVCLVYL